MRVDIWNDEHGFFMGGWSEGGDAIGEVLGLLGIIRGDIELSSGFIARVAIHAVQRGTSGKFDATDRATHRIMVRKELRCRQRTCHTRA